MNASWMRPRWRWAAVAAAAGTLAASAPAASLATAGQAARPAPGGAGYQATIVRTTFGIPHITARGFGSLGYGYGYALASDNLCTLASDYLTVEGQRSRYLGAGATYPSADGGPDVVNLDSDTFWQSVSDRHVIPGLLAARRGPAAISPQLRQLVAGYAAGYNRYLASVGGASGVPDPTCRGQAWVKPITALDAWLRIYQVADLDGSAAAPAFLTDAHPPAELTAADLTSGGPATAAALTARAAAAVAAPPAASGRAAVAQLQGLGGPEGLRAGIGSNAIAIGSAGSRDGRHGLLLGNPHFPWDGPDRFYQVQLTIPGTMNVEGGSLYGVPLVMIGFTATMAWSHTVSTASTVVPYQLSLVPGHPTQYIFDGRATPMTSRTVTVQAAQHPGGPDWPVRRTRLGHPDGPPHPVYTRYGPVFAAGTLFPWTARTAFAQSDANAGNLRILSHYLATDEARSVAGELAALRRYQGLPWVNTLAADSSGHALYSDIQATPHVTDAEAARCDTALGQQTFAGEGLPVLDGSRSSCALGTDRDSAVPGIFGPAEEPTLQTRSFAENSNDSYWLANPATPLTGFARIIGDTGTARSLRTRSALAMIQPRLTGPDGLGAPGFTAQSLRDLQYSDIQYGATLVKAQLVAMCRSFPGGRVPTSTGSIAAGNSCAVLAAWNGRENPGSRGAVLFRAFWEGALALPDGPWSHPFSAADPLGTPSGLNATSPAVQKAFGDALAELTAAHVPYDVPLGTLQFVVRHGQQIPLPGGPGDPDGDFNAIYSDIASHPGADPSMGSSYMQVVTWTSGSRCPAASTLVTYSESASPASPHSADQTRLFSQRTWATGYFCAAQVAAHAQSTVVLHG
jgi:acyl-homoserine-lactone acylase